jgi:AraC-like DNA-binding protein
MVCDGHCRGKSGREYSEKTVLVFPYRGLFLRHAAREETVAQPNQLLFFNQGEDYAVSHPVVGGDACLSLRLDDALLWELAPKDQLESRGSFRLARRRIDPGAQALVALLCHALSKSAIETFEAESLALTLVRRALGPRTSHEAGASRGRKKLVDRAKLAMGQDLSRRWTLEELGRAVGVSPVYLTQTFQEVEGVPLARYQMHLRLARALDLVPRAHDLTQLGLELGFSSHSHFTQAFRKAYGRTPAEFRRVARTSH